MPMYDGLKLTNQTVSHHSEMGTNCKSMAQPYRISDTIPFWLHIPLEVDSLPNIHNGTSITVGNLDTGEQGRKP